MKTRAILLALVLLAACGQQSASKGAANAPPNPQDLTIEIGRYGVMLDHVRNLTAETPAAANAAQPEEPVQLARTLRETVWAYNLERSRLCAKGLYTTVSCGAIYNPVWLSDAPDATPTLEELQQRADALGAEVQPFWAAVCDDVRARTTDEQAKTYVCAIE